jgi:hypothetical protein
MRMATMAAISIFFLIGVLASWKSGSTGRGRSRT